MAKRKPDPESTPAPAGDDMTGTGHGIRNRVVERCRILGSELAPHPKNWREHPKEQSAALKAVLLELGQAGELLAYRSERNGGKLTLINGHLRSADFPGELWDVAITDLTDAEADKLLAVLDPLAGMAGTDPAMLAALVESVGPQAGELDALLASIGSGASEVMFGDVEDDAGGDGKPNRSEGIKPKTFKVRPVLDMAQVRTLEDALMATGNMNRGEALTEICQAYLESKRKG